MVYTHRKHEIIPEFILKQLIIMHLWCLERYVVIIQNDLGNKYSPTVIAAAITSQTGKTKLPTHIEIDSSSCGLKSNSIVLAEQIRTIDKKRLREKVGSFDDRVLIKLDEALKISVGI